MENKEKKGNTSYLAMVVLNNQKYENSRISVEKTYIKIENSSFSLDKIITYQELVFFANNKESNMLILQYNCSEGIQGDEGSVPFSTIKIYPEDKTKLSMIFNKINKFNTLIPNTEFEGKIVLYLDEPEGENELFVNWIITIWLIKFILVGNYKY